MSRRLSHQEAALLTHELAQVRECYRGGFIAVCACRVEKRGKTEQAVRTWHARHAVEVPRKLREAEMATRCPNPAKKSYPSKEAAIRDLPRRWATQAWGSSNLTPYQCRCGNWHLTSRRSNWEARHEP